jgi:hypothetical protein
MQLILSSGRNSRETCRAGNLAQAESAPSPSAWRGAALERAQKTTFFVTVPARPRTWLNKRLPQTFRRCRHVPTPILGPPYPAKILILIETANHHPSKSLRIMAALQTFAGAACCHPIELQPDKAAPLQALGPGALFRLRQALGATGFAAILPGALTLRADIPSEIAAVEFNHANGIVSFTASTENGIAQRGYSQYPATRGNHAAF